MNRFEADQRFAQRMKDNYPPGTRWNAYSKLDSSFWTVGYCRHFIISLSRYKTLFLLGSVSESPISDGVDSRYRTQCIPLPRYGTLPLFYNNSDESLLS